MYIPNFSFLMRKIFVILRHTLFPHTWLASYTIISNYYNFDIGKKEEEITTKNNRDLESSFFFN